jgi:hypothetical protein
MRGKGIPAALAGGVLAATIALAPCPAFCQQAKGVFTPYVSRLAAEPAGRQVKLTWKDSTDVEGTCVVYRHTAEITPRTVGGALVVGRVSSGVEYFLDSPPDRQESFYAVLLEDSSKKLYSIFVPFRNTTTAGIIVTASDVPVSSSPIPPASADERSAASITNIRAAVAADGQAIEVSFRSSNPARDLLVFWGASPMRSAEDLLRSTSKSQLDGGETRYAVPTLPGFDSYFAVVDAGLFKLGQAPLEPGQNATTDPVQVPLGPSSTGLPARAAPRPVPLPGLDITSGVQTGLALPDADQLALPREKEVSAGTSLAIAEILRGIGDTTPGLRGQQILASEATPAATSELAGLQAIVKGPFTGGDLPEAERQLRDFLSPRRPSDVEGRARFYLGQTYYLQGRPHEALLEFLLAENVLYFETSSWKDACFRSLGAP